MLIRAPEGDAEARRQARQEALELKRQLEQGADFATLAREHSDDPGSARRGGDLGWFGRGRMVEPFEEAAFSAPIGRVVGPVETRFGYHLIEVTGRSNVEVQIADLAMRLAPSLATLNRIQERMEDLAYYAEESGDFEGEAQRMGLQVQEMRVEEDQQFLPGIGQSRAILNFLAGADEGDVSQVIELDDRFIVLQLVEVIPEVSLLRGSARGDPPACVAGEEERGAGGAYAPGPSAARLRRPGRSARHHGADRHPAQLQPDADPRAGP
ncbi:peptidylprolyl isomerase [Rhodothermus marinus]|uniref:peptidylprolyl isomerase n=1 Tax=Rhodothermus marinus TaxID=29549 RepID=UPI0034E2668C